MESEKLYKDLIERAKETLKRDKHHTPMIFIVGKELSIVALVFDTYESKTICLEKTRELLKEENANSYILIMESWFRAFEKMPEYKYPIKDYADKKEALVISLIKKEGGNKTHFIEFHKEGNNIIFDEEKEFKDNDKSKFGGSFYELFKTKRFIK